jgi:predicted lipoprotein with Yx(FWY)xxD motif
MRRFLAGAAGAAGIGLLTVACGSSSTAPPSPTAAVTSPVSSSPSAAGSQAAGAASVSLRAITGIPGKALVDSQGRTLYLFEADHGGKSTCSGACAAAWPPYTVTGTPHTGSGVNPALLTTIPGPGGSTQVVYNGHPLYYFSGDSHPGDHSGQGSKAFGAGWYVVAASGNKIDTS